MKIKKSICIDVDGVLAQYEGWQGVENIGDPIPGAVAFVKQLAEHYKIIIHTTRVNAEVNKGWTQDQLVTMLKAWLDKHGFKYDDIQPKPIAVAYIDDRAIVCTPMTSAKKWNWFAAATQSLQLLDPGTEMRFSWEPTE